MDDWSFKLFTTIFSRETKQIKFYSNSKHLHDMNYEELSDLFLRGKTPRILLQHTSPQTYLFAQNLYY